MKDMANHTSIFQDPISIAYKGIRVWEMPPNGQGLVALIALNILKNMDLETCDRLSCVSMHRLIEAVHLGFADGFKHICDATDPEILNKLLSNEYGKERASLIQENRYICIFH